MTIHEKIKELSEEELIELLLTFESGNMDYCYSIPQMCKNDCEVCLREWLNDEYDEDDGFYN